MEYENSFYDGPLAGSVLKSTIPLHQIVIQTESRIEVAGGARICPQGTHAYLWDYEEQVAESVTHRRFVVDAEERCEHGVADSGWCPECNAEYKRAREEE